MRKSIATVSLSGTLEEKLAAAAQVGFDGVEIFESDLVNCPSTPAEIRHRAEDLGLRIELYQPFRDFEAVPADMLARNLRRAERKFALMSELGVDILLVCSQVSAAAVGDDALAADHLHRLADLAAGLGIRVAYEALAWGRHVNDYNHAWKIIASVDHPNLGMCLDSFHLLSRRLDPAGIREIPGEKIFFLQVADAPNLVMDALQWSRHHRCLPGLGAFDLVGFLEHVVIAGYDGPLSLEVFNDIFRQADAVRTATDALRSLIALEESLARQLGRLPAGVAADPRERIELSVPPRPVDLSGYAFVEITVDPLAEMAAERLLRCMGFAVVGRHRSKPVRMWQQGEARVLLNRTRPDADDRSRGDAAVSAIAVESPDPARSAERAEALLAPPIPRRYGPGEADLAAIAAPDGISVFFCRTDISDTSSWLGDFEPLAIGTAVPAGVITCVDHVALSQPAYYFDEAALFYRSILGLEPHASEEVADPFGLVRSRAVTSGEGRASGAAGNGVRFVLNVPALGGGKPPETADFQHVAFSCLDIFAAARHMRAEGLPTLPVPGNYYQDLAARTELDDDLIDTMREHGVLYDRRDAGEFFHFYTAMLGRRIFFELVQRVNGYDGYGAPNTPVRMAAQYRHIAMAGITD
jgi:4-hydroxyphenylpyruvate dioxygenase